MCGSLLTSLPTALLLLLLLLLLVLLLLRQCMLPKGAKSLSSTTDSCFAVPAFPRASSYSFLFSNVLSPAQLRTKVSIAVTLC
jgi:hypothetical protein